MRSPAASPAMRRRPTTGRISRARVLTGSCTDAAGNSADASFTVKYDSTPPGIAFEGRTVPNGNGWNDTPVTLTWDCTDGGSGAVAATLSHTLVSDGAGQSSTGTCTDLAGNSVSDTQNGIDIDTTGPVVTPHPSTAADPNGWHAAPFTVTWDGSDAGSGIASCSSDSAISVETAGANAQGTCTDLAGNSSTADYDYKLDTEAPTLLQSDISAQGTNAGLLVSSYPGVSATDNFGTPTIACTPSAPHTFAAGQSTLVSCTATDAAGNQATGSFHVQVDGTPDLTVAATHPGTFTRGDGADTLTVVARNSGLQATSGTVTLVDTLPPGLTASAISGSGWSCVLATATCTRSDSLAAGDTYPAITISVAVGDSTADSVTNSATVSGGSEPAGTTGNDSSSDGILVVSPPPPAGDTPAAVPAPAPTPPPVVKSVQPDTAGSVSLPDTATVDWTAGALPADTTVAITPMAVPSGSSFLGPGATVVSIVATAPDGTEIHSLSAPLEIDFPDVPAGFVPETSEDGVTWRAIPLLAGKTLPSGQPDGYIRSGSTVEVLTRHLTLFALVAPTATAFNLSTTAKLTTSKHLLVVTVTTSRETHVDVALRNRGKVVGRWHRWLPSGKTTLKLRAASTADGAYGLVVKASGGGETKSSSPAVRRLR